MLSSFSRASAALPGFAIACFAGTNCNPPTKCKSYAKQTLTGPCRREFVVPATQTWKMARSFKPLLESNGRESDGRACRKAHAGNWHSSRAHLRYPDLSAHKLVHHLPADHTVSSDAVHFATS